MKRFLLYVSLGLGVVLGVHTLSARPNEAGEPAPLTPYVQRFGNEVLKPIAEAYGLLEKYGEAFAKLYGAYDHKWRRDVDKSVISLLDRYSWSIVIYPEGHALINGNAQELLELISSDALLQDEQPEWTLPAAIPAGEPNAELLDTNRFSLPRKAGDSTWYRKEFIEKPASLQREIEGKFNQALGSNFMAITPPEGYTRQNIRSSIERIQSLFLGELDKALAIARSLHSSRRNAFTQGAYQRYLSGACYEAAITLRNKVTEHWKRVDQKRISFTPDGTCISSTPFIFCRTTSYIIFEKNAPVEWKDDRQADREAATGPLTLDKVIPPMLYDYLQQSDAELFAELFKDLTKICEQTAALLAQPGALIAPEEYDDDWMTLTTEVCDNKDLRWFNILVREPEFESSLTTPLCEDSAWGGWDGYAFLLKWADECVQKERPIPTRISTLLQKAPAGSIDDIKKIEKLRGAYTSMAKSLGWTL